MPRGTLSSATSRVLRDCTRHPLVNELNPGDLWDSEQTMKEVMNVYFGLRSEKENVVAKEELVPKVLRHVKALGEKGEFALSAFGACVIYLRQVLLDQTLLAVRRIELLPSFNALLDDPESKALVEQEERGVDAALHRIEPYMMLDGAALENLEVLENSNGGTTG
jgi:DNA mismatch repair protein MSH6